MHMYEKLIREGRTGFENMAEVHNALSEDLSFRRVIGLARERAGHRALLHARERRDRRRRAIREARARGMPVYGETLHQYLMYTAEDYRRPNGQMYHTYPSLKSRADQEGCGRRRSDGTIHTVATDEVCCSLNVKTQGKRIDDTTGGNVGVEPRVVAHVHGDGRPARLLAREVRRPGLDERGEDHGPLSAQGRARGRLRRRHRGARPGARHDDKKEMLHESDYTPWEGHEVHAWPRSPCCAARWWSRTGYSAATSRTGGSCRGRSRRRFAAGRCCKD